MRRSLIFFLIMYLYNMHIIYLKMRVHLGVTLRDDARWNFYVTEILQKVWKLNLAISTIRIFQSLEYSDVVLAVVRKNEKQTRSSRTQ